MPNDPIKVLFLCTGNSARSILSEAILNDLGEGRFQAYSAGSHPSDTPHPDCLAELEKRGHNTDNYSSKSWDVYAHHTAPKMDLIITVCGNAANEVCPVWPRKPGHDPIKIHWPVEDPAHIEPLSARQAAFAKVYGICRARIEALIGLSPRWLDNRRVLQDIASIP